MKPFADFWSQLGSGRRVGFVLGLALVFATTLALGYWALRDPYVPILSQLSAEKMAIAARELDRAKIAYRILPGGEALEVPSSAAGKARLALSGSAGGGAPVGLELFNETDFSMTEFAQKVNYQRALQGELTRTIESMDGVRSARVHIVLSEGGVLRRTRTPASAAVTLAMQHGRSPSRAQIRGIQRLVAASVPDVEPASVAVIDEAGVSLTGGDGPDYSGGQLETKQQFDNYLEQKLRMLLADLVPASRAAVTVDARLDFKQVKTTIEEPLVSAKDASGERATGVVIRERQTQRSAATGGDRQAGGADEDVAWEYDYKVGHRIEHSMSAPGALTRLSVAVVLQGAPEHFTAEKLELLIAGAAGIDKSRGDVVSVLLLPAIEMPMAPAAAALTPPTIAAEAPPSVTGWMIAAAAALVIAVSGLWARARQRAPETEPDAEQVAAQVRHWLSEGSNGS